MWTRPETVIIITFAESHTCEDIDIEDIEKQ